MRQHVSIVFTLGDLGREFERRRMMPPSQDSRDVGKLFAIALGPRGREFFRGEEERDRTVSYLRAIAYLDPSANHRVKLALLLGMALAHKPVAGLRVRIAFRIRIIDRRNVCEMLILQAVALVVLVAEPAEKFRERELDSLGLALIPRGGAEIIAAGGRVHRLHLLDADYAG